MAATSVIPLYRVILLEYAALAKYKMKTHKSGAKRYKISGSGKILHRQGWRGHLNTKKSGSRKRRLEGWTELSPANENKVTFQLPYRNKKYST
ncbi:MAG: 50S ribosomal protein L35 [Cyanobacteria bacterium HKST-UBA04]|nr:50S ribosomal protein L35 [Cyanobacteria bacterium HKST-UBA04]